MLPQDAGRCNVFVRKFLCYRSSHHSVREPKDPATGQQNSNPMKHEENNFERIQSIFGGLGPSSPRYHVLEETPILNPKDLDSGRESPSNGKPLNR